MNEREGDKEQTEREHSVGRIERGFRRASAALQGLQVQEASMVLGGLLEMMIRIPTDDARAQRELRDLALKTGFEFLNADLDVPDYIRVARLLGQIPQEEKT